MKSTILAGLLALGLGAGCSFEEDAGAAEGDSGSGKGRGRAPSVVSDLVLARDTEEMTPVLYPHARHLDPDFAGRQLACAECHHTLEDVPGSLPMACGTCHPHEQEEGKPADI